MESTVRRRRAMLADILRKQDKPSDAIRSYIESLQIEELPEVHVRLGYMLSSEGKTDEAIFHFHPRHGEAAADLDGLDGPEASFRLSITGSLFLRSLFVPSVTDRLFYPLVLQSAAIGAILRCSSSTT